MRSQTDYRITPPTRRQLGILGQDGDGILTVGSIVQVSGSVVWISMGGSHTERYNGASSNLMLRLGDGVFTAILTWQEDLLPPSPANDRWWTNRDTNTRMIPLILGKFDRSREGVRGCIEATKKAVWIRNYAKETEHVLNYILFQKIIDALDLAGPRPAFESRNIESLYDTWRTRHGDKGVEFAEHTYSRYSVK